MRRASALITVSDSTADEVRRFHGGSKVSVIKEGVDTTFFHKVPSQAQQIVKAKYGLDQFIISVGTLHARKNHLRLIQAFEQIQGDILHDLVIAGVPGSGAEELQQYLNAHPNPRVHLLGYVDDALLPALYSAADLFVLVSLWEGFGLPVLEAMACHVPVLTSANSALQEISGDAALTVDPTDTDAIAAAIKQLLTDTALRQQLIQAGITHIDKFSWEQAARQTVAVYRQVAELK
jgi:glycosyltransferase involved in cell wall biosynthesis